MRELSLDKKREELIEQERYAKERALEGEHLFKEENELLCERIKELEAQKNKL